MYYGTMGQEVERRRGLYGFEMLEPDERRVDDVNKRKTYDSKQMWQRHHEVVNLSLRGLKNVEIAEVLRIHPQTVTNILNGTLGMKKMSELRKMEDGEAQVVADKIKTLTERALSVYHDILDDDVGDPDLKKKTADTVVLELSGLRVPTKVQSQHVSTVLTKDELEEFKERGIKAARASGLIVDVEPAEGGNGDGDIESEESSE